MPQKRPFVLLAIAGLLAAVGSLGSTAMIDESSARTAITQSYDNVLAALVQVDTTCHREDDLCMDGVRVVQVLLDRNPQGARIKAGGRFLLHVGRGDDPATPKMGDQILFVGTPLNPKAAESDYTAKVMTVSPSRKDIDELRYVIANLPASEATPAH
jgi:hypothetical protein